MNTKYKGYFLFVGVRTNISNSSYNITQFNEK